MMYIYEGGNIFGDGDIAKEYVAGIVKTVQRDLPSGIKAIPDIGSAGYKVASGDMDLFIDASALIQKFGLADEKAAKIALEQFMAAKGYKTKISGRNVHIEVPYATPEGQRTVQVDLMVIADADVVAPWHQHGPRGMYDQPNFKASHGFIVMNSIAKHLGLKFDAFGAKLMRRDDNTVVGRTRDEVAKILLGQAATGNDLNSVNTMVAALKNDPDKDSKLAQARQDAAKGIITMPEPVQEGSAQWFRKYTSLL